MVLHSLLVTICGSIAVYLNDYFLSISISPFVSVLASSFLAGLIYFIIIIINQFVILKISSFRRWLYVNSKYEGYWIETIRKQDVEYYSLITIGYSPTNKKYKLKGTACTKNGGIHATWSSNDIVIDADSQKIYYYYFGNSGDSKVLAEEGITIYEFFENSNFGTGYFVDFGTNLVKVNFNIDRINRNEIRHLINKRKITASEDVINLLTAYHEKYGSSRQYRRGGQ